MRSVRALSALLFLPALVSCAADVGSSGLAINDPLGLIDDVQGPLRLFVLPADAYACDATTGAVSPDVPDIEQGMLEDAIADVSLTVMSSAARAELSIPAGEYTVLVRGKGTDPVTGIPNTFIATGCSDVMIDAGATVEIHVTLIPIVGMGVCGDSIQSPDEQCEDGNTAAGDGCSATCRTEPIVVSTATGSQDSPSLGGASGRHWVSTYTSDSTSVAIRLLEADGGTIASPSALMTDAPLTSTGIGTVSGVYALADVAVAGNGRIGASFTALTAQALRVAFWDENRNAAGPSVLVRMSPGASAHSSVAFAGDGSFMVVFEDATSATGLSGQVFAAGSTTPVAADPFPVGASGGSDPDVSGASDHFVVAYAAGGDVFVQRFGTDGSARDAAPVAVLEDAAGTQDQPAVAALADGRALVAWRDDSADGAGKGIRARAFGTDGSPAANAFVVNTTTAGDQNAPSAAGGNGAFAIAFESGGAVRARIISGGGDPLPNHGQPPTTADFEVAASGAQPAAAVGGPNGSARFMVAWSGGGDIHGRLFPLP